jgi:heparosan-N-sulfate-glucuronate 5-epimerase
MASRATIEVSSRTGAEPKTQARSFLARCADRLHYCRRVFHSYLLPGSGQLRFWHDTPQMNPNMDPHELAEYYMPFLEKGDYSGLHDASGIPMLDYHGRIGLQYNPIAIAQWGLGNYNAFLRGNDAERKKKFLLASDWLCSHLKQNSSGVWVWNHDFDWEYRTKLNAPWYSGLAQGQGISLLVRAWRETNDPKYLSSAQRAFRSFCEPTSEGGVCFMDELGDIWFEEYIVAPPTHILNGFIWAAWGVHDYFLATADINAEQLFLKAATSLRRNLPRYDLGFWSLYEQSGTRLPMLASLFYHRLHIVQLRVMYRLTGDALFSDYADRWENYERSPANRNRALCYKAIFKLCYY